MVSRSGIRFDIIRPNQSTYPSSSIFVLLSWYIDCDFLVIPGHIWTIGTHWVEKYSTKLWGKAGLLEILSKIWLKSATSGVDTSFLIRAHNSGQWLVWKCNWIAWSMCQVHRSTWPCGKTVSSAAICAWSQSVIRYTGRTCGFQDLTKWRKYEIVALWELDDSIQATGTPETLEIKQDQPKMECCLPCPQWSLTIIVKSSIPE